MRRLPTRNLIQNGVERGFLGLSRNDAKMLGDLDEILGRQLVELLNLGRDVFVSHVIGNGPIVERSNQALGIFKAKCRRLRFCRSRSPGGRGPDGYDAGTRVFLGTHQECREILH